MSKTLDFPVQGVSFSRAHNPSASHVTFSGFDQDGKRQELTVPLFEALAMLNFLRHVENEQQLGALTQFIATQRSIQPAPLDEPVPPVEDQEPIRRLDLQRRVDALQRDAMLNRYYQRALNNELAIAIGSSSSPPKLTIPAFAARLNEELAIGFDFPHMGSYFERWDEFVDAAEKKLGWQTFRARVRELLSDPIPTELQRLIATLPISNFIDATLDRGLVKALIDEGKRPIVHDYLNGQIGSWRQTDPSQPHIFYVLQSPVASSAWTSVKTFIGEPQNPINRENIGEMLRRRDLLLVDFGAFEAEYILHLGILWVAGQKITNCSADTDDSYWSARGVYVSRLSANDFVGSLQPGSGKRYGALDAIGPAGHLIDLGRKRRFHCFISYSRKDYAFVDQLTTTLRVREIHPWHDVKEMEVGTPVDSKIDEALNQSYAFVIILSPDALASAWVQAELRRAEALAQTNDIVLLPVLLSDCEIPESLARLDWADFRDVASREESIDRLVIAIRKAADQSEGKL